MAVHYIARPSLPSAVHLDAAATDEQAVHHSPKAPRPVMPLMPTCFWSSDATAALMAFREA
eukprot:1733173-Alexandrium_andersonii.AAC.1